MTRKSRLLANYDKICPICGKLFYNKSFIVKYCSKDCATTSRRIQQKVASAKWRERQRIEKKLIGDKNMTCKHFWMELESDNLGKPTKYKCVLCNQEYSVKPKVLDYFKEYFDKINSIKIRISENKQKIEFIKLNPIDINSKIHLAHLEKEIITLNKLLSQCLSK